MSSKARRIHSKKENLFARPLKYMGILLIIIGIGIGITATIGAVITAVLFILVGGYFATAYKGIVLDPNTKSIKQYTSFWGYKKGVFRKLDGFPFITLLEKNRGSGKNQKSVFEVYLLSKSHRGKKLVHINSSIEAATAVMNKIAKAFVLQEVEYNAPERVRKGSRYKLRQA